MTRLLLFLLSLHLFAVSLLPGADAHALVEVADAWQHRADEHAGSGLWHFVYDHFVATDSHEHPGHADDHQSLPLHHGHEICGASLCLLPAPWVGVPAAPAFAAEAAPRRQHPTDDAPAGVARSWWQPPRA